MTTAPAAAAKPWWQSKTLLLNIFAAALVALEASTGILRPYVGDQLYLVIAAGLPVINAVLRVVTTQALAIGPGRGQA